MENLELVRDLLAQIVRVGFVSARDPAKCRVRALFEDTTGGETVSGWLPVLLPRARDDAAFDLPDIGDQVLCLFLPIGRESGFVLGCMYGADAPPVSSGDKWHRKFKDGTWLEYDRAAHKLGASVRGDVEVEADKSITAKAGDSVKIEAGKDITAQAGGSITAQATLDAFVQAGKDITATAGMNLTALAGLKASVAAVDIDLVGTASVKLAAPVIILAGGVMLLPGPGGG
ncbi:MAG: phage baseplate assembly protein V, partial [Deltaproteobacteria bacterium]|nr:phage baseplate assembly protein V [Deltaproteobacteria bacterium]